MQRVKGALADQRKIINQIKAHLRAKFKDEATGHDWWHIERVLSNAVTIAKKGKGAELFVVRLGRTATMMWRISNFIMATKNSAAKSRQNY